MFLATDAAPPGEPVRAAVVAQIAPGYHVNNHRPTKDYLIPTDLKLDPNRFLSVERVIYPKGELKKFAFSEEPLAVYEGSTTLGVLLRVVPTARPGSTVALRGRLSYQACNDHACLPPSSVPVALAIKVVGRSIPLKRANADVFRRIEFE